MIGVAQARETILAAMRPTGAETVALEAAFERVLAVPARARLRQPPADVSAMDGYAVRAADVYPGATLRVRGAAPAGHPFNGDVGENEAVRLFTGSLMPHGADAVLLQEHAVAQAGEVLAQQAVIAGKHVRRGGLDFEIGEILLSAGTRLSARDIGVAAAGNHPWLSVHRRPRIAILATGDEISLPGQEVPPGGIVSSNGHMLAAFVRRSGGEPMVLPPVPDDPAAIAAGADAALGADILVTTGGASVGDHDMVQQGLARRGLELSFWKIAMRPGKPLIFGRLGPLPVLGLPGNPVSAFVCAVLFLGPAIDRLSGLPGVAPPLEIGRVTMPMKRNDDREDYVRARLVRDEAGWRVTPFSVQDSGMLRTLAQADALLRRPPRQPELAAGALVDFIRL